MNRLVELPQCILHIIRAACMLSKETQASHQEVNRQGGHVTLAV